MHVTVSNKPSRVTVSSSCSVLQCVAMCCSVLQCVEASPVTVSSSCSVLQCVAACCSVCSVLQCVAVRCSVLQCAAVCRSVSQCVAVCRSVLQCVTSSQVAVSSQTLPTRKYRVIVSSPHVSPICVISLQNLPKEIPRKCIHLTNPAAVLLVGSS